MWNIWFEDLDTYITTFFQSSDHDINYSNNYNKASNADYDYNSYDELLEPYISCKNYPQMNEIGNPTSNEVNNTLNDDNTNNF